MPLILLGLLIWMNVRLAKRKGRHTLAWGLITFVAFFVASCLLGSIYIMMIYKGPLTVGALSAYTANTPLVNLMITMLGVGGTLAVRAFLERSKTNELK